MKGIPFRPAPVVGWRAMEAGMGKHFVLIHGAWHGGWCWDGVIEELSRLGHTAEAPTMPGHGPRDDRDAVTFEDYERALMAALDRQRGKVVLVGHSAAGLLLQAVAPRAAARIERVVFHNAFALPDGRCLLDVAAPEMASLMRELASRRPDRSVPVVEQLFRGQLMVGEPLDVQERILSRLLPQPLALFTTPISTKAFIEAPIPRSVVLCTDDHAIPWMDLARAALGEFKLVELPGCHETLLTQPAALAAALHAAV